MTEQEEGYRHRCHTCKERPVMGYAALRSLVLFFIRPLIQFAGPLP